MKRRINEETKNNISNVLYKYDITEDIFNHARKMDMDLIRLFYDKIIKAKDNNSLVKNKDDLSQMLFGVYGNYCATKHFKDLGYDVINEYSIKDRFKREITKADIAFYDDNNKLNLCEVKATPQIIDNIRNYKSDNEDMYNDSFYYDKDAEIIKYKEIGKKVLKQTKKLKTRGDIVNVVLFKECYIDDIIKDKLKNTGCNIIYINYDINKLKRYVYDIVTNITEELNSNKIIFYKFKSTSK